MEVKTLEMNFGYETEDIKINNTNFIKSTGFEKGITRYKEDYSFYFKGDNLSKDFEDDWESDILETPSIEKHKFNEGDKILVIENYDWDENLSEFAGEIEFIDNTYAYYGEESSSVYFILGSDRYVKLSGDYYPLESESIDKINKFFETNYKEIFIGS